MFFLRTFLLTLCLAFISMPASAIEHRISEGESLSKILVMHGFEGDAKHMYFETRKVFQQNRHAFRRANINLLIPGKVLMLPDYTPQPVIAGTLSIRKGEVRIIRQEDSISVEKPTELHSGDIVLTMADSNGQLKMRDGALFELGPYSRFSIDDYVHQEDESLIDKTGRMIVTLFSGVARAVTGKIGRRHKENFQFRTVIATIGIRGTDYTVRYCEGENCGTLKGTSVAVVDGGVVLKNASGELPINKGEFAIAASASSAPVSAPMPEGFLDMNKNITEIKPQQLSWWQKILELF